MIELVEVLTPLSMAEANAIDGNIDPRAGRVERVDGGVFGSVHEGINAYLVEPRRLNVREHRMTATLDLVRRQRRAAARASAGVRGR